MKQNKHNESRNLNIIDDNKVIDVVDFLRRFLLFIIVTTLLCTVAGFGLAQLRNKPVYTASKSVLFFAHIQEGASDVNYDTQLTQYLFDTAETQIKTPKYIADANEIYKKLPDAKGSISSSKIKVISNSNESLIFTISYSDNNELTARQKLGAVIESAKINLSNLVLSSGQINLYEVQNDTTISIKDSLSKYLVGGFIIGLAGSVITSFIIVFVDKTVKYKDELEYLTGASVIAVIEKV